MSTSYPQRVAVRFGEFEFDHSGELHSGARKIKLQEQPSQILRLLMERAGEIVTREEPTSGPRARETLPQEHVSLPVAGFGPVISFADSCGN